MRICSATPAPDEPHLRADRWRVLLGLWLTYGSYYLCRVNWAAAQKALQAGLGVTKTELGQTLTGFRLLYGASQVAIGQLADRFGPTPIIAIGIVGSIAANIGVSASHSYATVRAFWLANALFQGCGWSAVMLVFSAWFPGRLRGSAAGWLSTSYQVGNAAGWALAGALVSARGWQAAFWFPAAGFALLGGLGLWLWRSRGPRWAPGRRGGRAIALQDGLLRTLRNRRVWVAALSWMFLAIGLHGLMDWLPQYLAEETGLGAGAASLRASIMPLAGALGAVTLGWATDRLSGGRRAPVLFATLLGLTLVLAVTPSLMRRGPAAAAVVLPAIGLAGNGAGAIISSALAIDASGGHGAAGATGLVDAMGYLGGAVSSGTSGYIVDRLEPLRGAPIAWGAVWWLWAGGVLMAALLMGMLWRRDGRQGPP